MGGAGPAASTFLKRLADNVSTKKSTTYAQALGWLMPLVKVENNSLELTRIYSSDNTLLTIHSTDNTLN